MPISGTVITAQAFASFIPENSTTLTTIRSNTVIAIVQPVEALTLNSPNDLKRPASSIVTADNGAYYVLGEEMAAGSVSSLSRYSSTVACVNRGVGGTDVSQIRSFTDVIAPAQGDTIVCTITNSSPGGNLTLKQVIAPGSGQPPFNFDYTVGNGWGNTSLSSAATGAPGVSSDTRVLAASATDTPIAVNLPPGWRVVPEASACSDSNGASSGNGNTGFGTLANNTLTVPAANLRTGSALVCTVTLGLAAPSVTLNKALGAARLNNNDQFTVLLKQGNTTLQSASTTGSGATVDAGSGSTGPVAVAAGGSYSFAETMAANSVSNLAQYSATVSCQNTGAGGTVVSNIHTLIDSLVPQAGDVIVCTLSNTPVQAVAMLTITQRINPPLPASLIPPFRFTYTGNNGWTNQTLQSTPGQLLRGATQNLSATNVETTVGTTLPEPRWFVKSFSCTDSNASDPSAIVASSTQTSVTLPAASVRSGANLVCAMVLAHRVP